MKSAHEVFAGFEVDAGLAADRAVHLREQGRGRLDKRDAPQVSRRDKARQVADDAAAQSHDERSSLEAMAGEAVATESHHVEALGRFPRGNNQQHGVDARLAQRRQGRLGV